MKKIIFIFITYLCIGLLSHAQDNKESITLDFEAKPSQLVSFYLETEGNVTIKGLDSIKVDEKGQYTGLMPSSQAGDYEKGRMEIQASRILCLTLENIMPLWIDVSLCPSLKKLDLGKLEGAMQEIDLSGLSNLETLRCAKNKLQELVVKDLKQLKELDCSQNQLTGLDLSNLDKLESVNATGNKIRSPKLEGLPHLKTLSLAENPLGKVLKIDLPELLWLKVSRCGLEKLELVNAPNLEGLECSENKLSSLDLANANTKIQFLECFLNNIDGTEMGKLIASLPNWNDSKNPGNGKCYAMSYGFSPEEPDENEKNFAYEDDVKKAWDKQWAFMAKTKDGKEVKYAGRPRSTQQIANSEIVISPNPATDFVSIQGVSPNTEVRILDLSGKLLIESLARSEGVLNLDVRAIPEGNYLVVINGSSQKLAIIR